VAPTPAPTEVPTPTLKPTPDNQPPVAIIGAVADYTPGQTVTLDGSGSSDPEGDDITYLWTQTQGEQVALTDNTGPTLSFVAPTVTETTTFSFQLTVDDGSLSDNASVQFLVLPVMSDSTAPGLHVSGRQLLESNGNAFVMRGVNVAHAWYPGNTASSLSDIAKTGANSARIVLSSGDRWNKTSESVVSELIEQAKANKLIAILEVHDTTGYGEQEGAATLSQAVDYWKSIKGALIGQEDYVVVNIGNEPFGNGQTASAWIDGHIEAIQALRDAGFKHAIMVDGPSWGQDWKNTMRDNAASVLAADPQKNVVFSVHMYQIYKDASTIDTYMSAFIQNDLTLVVGEFGADHIGEEVDEASVMSYAEQYGYGYLGWSWSGNSGGTESLDIVVDFDASRLSSWGETLINGNNGIKATSSTATIFDSSESAGP
jgi:mannan endo-1,4-beta-mannosidase